MGSSIGNGVRLMAAAAAAVLVAACVFAVYGVVPSGRELADPLGLPVRLARAVAGSGQAFDDNTAALVEQSTVLQERTAGAEGVAISVAQMQDLSARLGELVKALNARVGGLGTAARGVPGPVDTLTKRAQQGASDVGGLSGGAAALDASLGRLVATLQALHTDVAGLGPNSRSLATTLNAIRQDTAALGVLQALLRSIGGTK